MLLIVLMWIGRLEIVTALVMFTPGFWKDLTSNRKHRGRQYKGRRHPH